MQCCQGKPYECYIFRTFILSHHTESYIGGITPNSIKIFRKQKKVLRITNKSKKMDSCKELFKTMEILHLDSRCVFSLLMYVVNNKHLFTKS